MWKSLNLEHETLRSSQKFYRNKGKVLCLMEMNGLAGGRGSLEYWRKKKLNMEKAYRFETTHSQNRKHGALH